MWKIGGKTLKSRLLLGTSRYPSPEILEDSIQRSKAEVLTVSLRRQTATNSSASGNHFYRLLKKSQAHLLPNTAGCTSVKEAVTTAKMARDLFETHWIKLEVIGNDDTLQPDPFATVKAAEILVKDGFEVFPYTTEDLVIAERLVASGCKIIMPWAAPIGTGRGLVNPDGLRTLRQRLPQTNLIVDAGIGRPSDAAQVMEMGYDGVLINTAVATSLNPPMMAEAFAHSIGAGYLGHKAGIITKKDRAQASTPVVGQPFWHYQQEAKP